MYSNNTQNLLNLLQSTKDIDNYITQNNDDFLDIEFLPLVNEYLANKGITKYRLFQNVHIDINYGYQILNGSRKPNRNKILQLAFGLTLSLEETQLLLMSAKEPPLYVRNRRDSIIIFGLNNQLSLLDIEEILIQHMETTIVT